MPRYAQIDANGYPVSISDLSTPVSDASLIPLTEAQDITGKRWNGSAWVAVEDQRPRLVITDLTSDDNNAEIVGVAEVTCKAGAQVMVSAELRLPNDSGVLPLNAAFRMPFRARDGRERLLLVALTNGTAAVSAVIGESGVWSVTEDIINEGLTPAEQMRFDGLTLYVTL